MCKNTLEPNRPLMALKYGAEKMRFAGRVTKGRIEKLTQNVSYLLLFSLHKWLRERTWMLRYTYFVLFV